MKKGKLKRKCHGLMRKYSISRLTINELVNANKKLIDEKYALALQNKNLDEERSELIANCNHLACEYSKLSDANNRLSERKEEKRETLMNRLFGKSPES